MRAENVLWLKFLKALKAAEHCGDELGRAYARQWIFQGIEREKQPDFGYPEGDLVGLMFAGRTVFTGTPDELIARGDASAAGDAPLERGYSAVMAQARE